MTRLWFMGSGAFGARCLEHLCASLPLGISLERVITGNPARAGRGLKETASRVEAAALALGLPLERTGPLTQNKALLGAVEADPPDAVLVVDFAQLIREPFLSAPRWGCLNIHPSLLPRWRGAAPIQRALMNGDAETGVTVFRLVPEMDAGPILRQASVPVGLTDSASGLYKKLSAMGSQIAVNGVQYYLLNSVDNVCQFLKNQDEGAATYAPKLDKAEGAVSWAWEALRIHNVVRALDASFGAFAVVKGTRLKIWRTLPLGGFRGTDEDAGRVLRFSDGFPVVGCGGGALRLDEVQAEGKKRVGGAEWARGLRLKEGDVL